MFETIDLRQDARGVARLVLNRPEKHNSLSERMIAELTEAAGVLGADPGVRVVVLAASGQSFCAGGDLAWMKAQMAGGAAARRDAASALAGMLHALDTMAKPLIGRIHGAAYGGGVGMMAVCDLAVGVAGLQFGLTETRLGLIPATIGPYVVARIGAAGARRHMLGARPFGSDEALRLGLLHSVAAPDALDAALEAEIAPFLTCAPGAVAAAKAMIRRLAPPVGPEVIAATIDLLIDRWEGAEAAEGIAAFLERRAPGWQR